MLERAPRQSLRVSQIGCIAARALRDGAAGEVRSIFERSLYLTVDQQWICVGPAGLGMGPLNALCESWDANNPSTKWIGVGDRVAIHERTALVGHALAIEFAGAAEWSPEGPGSWTAASVVSGLSALAAALPDVLPAEGLALLLRPQSPAFPPPVVATAQPAASYLADLVRVTVPQQTFRQIDPSLLAPLLGLGPGLTPSGDDFVGGGLIALDILGLTESRDQIWSAIAPLARTSTNDVSYAHLSAAADGQGSAAVHALLNDVMTGQNGQMAERIASVAAIGHTSGWDASAGAVTVLRAYCAVSTCPR